jgi:hypothetical protein
LKFQFPMQTVLVPFFLLLLQVFGAPDPALCQSPSAVRKILVLRPVLHAGQEMDFLRSGIVEMLSGRLTLPDKVSALSQDDAAAPAIRDDTQAVAMARRMAVDYVVLESVIILGNSVSTDARVLEASSGKTVLTFSRTGKDQADIIAHIDELAAQINSRLLGRAAAVATEQAPAAAPPGTTAQVRDNIHQHPEKLLTGVGGDRSGLLAGYDDESATAAVRLLVRGRRMDTQLRGVSVGDVDGDGASEIVCIDSSTVVAFRLQQAQLTKMAQSKFGKANVSVDAADLNGNGIDELFITHFDNDSGRVLSYVLEWDGNAFKRTADNLRWYFRVVDLFDRGRVLLGQRQGIDERFAAGIYEMEYKDGRYDAGQKLALPRNRNVFGFAQGAVRTAATSDMVDYSRSGYLRVMDSKGREEWTSTESYGGTDNTLVVKSKDDPNEKDILFLPSRVHLLDLDGDGLQEIVAVRNKDAAGAFSRTRLFKQGRLEILKWDQMGLMPVWRTRNVAKYIGDFTVADFNGDGKPEIVAAIVQKTRNMLGAGSSYLAVFSLDNLAGKGP